MQTTTWIFVVAAILVGCSTQEPVRIVDAKCDSTSCEGQLAALREKSLADQAACDQTRQAAESCASEKQALARQLQEAQVAQVQTQQDLSGKAAELVQCQGGMTALGEQAQAAEACRQREGALEQQLQALRDAQTQTQQGLTGKEAELAACRNDLLALKRDAEAVAADAAAMRQELQKHAKAAEASSAQLQRMKELERNLRERLQGDIDAQDVEIDRLRSQLSVRVLDRILFETGSAEIMPRGKRVLDAVAAALASGDETIRIEGHADTVPIGPRLKEKYYSNWELSTGRASSVARYFADKHGIEPTRMEAAGYSKYRPIAPNDTEENRQRNRRVEIRLTPWKPLTEDCSP